MNHIKELIKGLKPKNEAYCFIYEFKKEGEMTCDDQDRKHLRILSILQLAHNREALEYILNHKFSESFKVDKDRRLVYYKIRIIKERRKYRGDC